MVAVVAVTAFLGAVGRHMVGTAVQRWSRSRWPVGTLAVNLTGSLALGLLVGYGLHHSPGDATRAGVGTGFLGAYTTFSAFGYETVRLFEDGARRHAALNIVASLACGLAAAGAGIGIAAVVWS